MGGRAFRRERGGYGYVIFVCAVSDFCCLCARLFAMASFVYAFVNLFFVYMSLCTCVCVCETSNFVKDFDLE